MLTGADLALFNCITEVQMLRQHGIRILDSWDENRQPPVNPRFAEAVAALALDMLQSSIHKPMNWIE